ncbi:MAG TPA: hypothetical protein VG147_03275 [Solirubrobacteraceae bacterium]|nr:hypothetical protein [Solirubrobacteraceae bacterium]
MSSATVFGLDVSADAQLPFLQHAPAAPTGRGFAISVAAGQSAAVLGWPDSAELVCDQRAPDGTVNFRIEAHPEAGYLIWGPTWGSHLISADGRSVVCATGDCAQDAWQRLLIAQVLPFAAVLHGLEVFHAGAVVRAGSAIALIGPSRAGKTSVALELCRRGASFLTDDVLAVERSGEELLGHPGTPVAGLDHAEAQRLAHVGEAQREEIVAVNAREQLVRMRGAAEPAPLEALFILDRRGDAASEPRFEAAADPQLLLAATFNSVLTAPARLRELLDICALAARRRVERIVAGPEVDATQLAVAIEQRLGVSP